MAITQKLVLDELQVNGLNFPNALKNVYYKMIVLTHCLILF
ncbi:hypothetical protein [Aquisalibacillus elongatus]|uniref:Uncharacterized protein n=1 Tax=Aquisalibacillus elongatus TaxID=485577 RepID=A0A3N5C3V7_9BACI|nr:hypothetical protein [Aquisalibacillus elongatus]RPF54142.1 hypothetical protein EDC24_1332 [Aquisalibacillus elongatus]